MVAALFALLFPFGAAGADRPAGVTANRLAERVGHVFAGYDDFWVWVKQRSYDETGTPREVPSDGRAYYKRDKMFRLNFGQPPVLIHGTDGGEYWIYDRARKTIRYSKLSKDTPVHPLLPVFAMGDRMAKALDRYFDVESLVETDFTYRDRRDKKKTAAVYKLVITLKPGQLKKLRAKGGHRKLLPDAKQTWTFWVSKKDWVPKRIQIDWETKRRNVYDFRKFYYNVDLSERLFRRPRPPGITPILDREGG